MKDDKRKEYISWDQYFMGLAVLASKRSKDPVTQVGCCIERDNKILSLGYNGFPNGCNDDDFPWTKGDEDLTKNKYAYVCHAELNAILNYRGDLTGSTAYVTLFPCNECAKAIIQSGITKIVYKEIKDSKATEASIAMLLSAHISILHYKPEISTSIAINV